MKKFISLMILAGFCSINLPSYAIFRSTVSESKQLKQELKAKKQTQQKVDKEIYRKVKQKKDLPYKKYKVANKYDFINMEWWENFDDPYLLAYISKAMEYNYDLKIASLTVDEYFQSVRLQMSAEMPQLQAGYGLGLAGLPKNLLGKKDTVHGMGLPVIASYEADIFLKNHDKTTAQKKLFQASVYDERATYISIVSAIGEIYFNIIKLDKSIELQEEIVNLRKNIYDLMALSHENGIVSTSDMIKSNKSYIHGQTALIDLKKQRITLLNRLAVLIGESPENIGNYERKAYDEISYTYDIPNEIPSDVIIQRPDYLKAEALLKKSGIDLRVAKKEFLPSIDILGLALFSAKHLGSLFSANNTLWAGAGNLTLPIFTGGARIANLRINKIRCEKALRNYQKTNLVAIQEVNDALYVAKSDFEKLKQNQEHLKLESQDFDLTEKRFEEGIISKLDLCQMKENLLVIEQLTAVNTLDCLIDKIYLYKATGAKLNF